MKAHKKTGGQLYDTAVISYRYAEIRVRDSGTSQTVMQVNGYRSENRSVGETFKGKKTMRIGGDVQGKDG